MVFPKTPEKIAAVLRIAQANRLPMVTRGSGTGLSGGSLPVPDCIALCIVQMDRVLKLDEKNLTVLVEAGVVTQKIAELADAAGLLYPPDPGSMKISTIGGNVAENAGGLRGLKYGVNPGCSVQLEAGLRQAATSVKVVHPVSLLAAAFRRAKKGVVHAPCREESDSSSGVKTFLNTCGKRKNKTRNDRNQSITND